MWSQVRLRRQVNHHVYLKPVLGTDQTFSLPASPLCRSFPPVFPSTLIHRPTSEAACRQTPDKAGTQRKGKDWKNPLWSVCASELLQVRVQHRFLNGVWLATLQCLTVLCTFGWCFGTTLLATLQVLIFMHMDLISHSELLSGWWSSFCDALFVTMLCITFACNFLNVTLRFTIVGRNCARCCSQYEH